MQSLVKFFGCGQHREALNKSVGEFTIESIKDINEKITPFFDKYPIRGVKVNDYEDFIKVVEIVRSKSHLTESGLEQIRGIKLEMNSNRKLEN
jgi:hypothetical protein